MKQVSYGSLAVFLALLLCSPLFAQAKKLNVFQDSPGIPSNAPTATWEIVEPEEVPTRHKKVGNPTKSIDGSSASYRGRFKGTVFTISFRPSTEVPGQGLLVLTIGGKSQEFTVVHQSWRLVWAGDADGDHKLDVAIETTGDGGGSGTDLYLSSLANPGELLHYSSSFDVTEGC